MDIGATIGARIAFFRELNRWSQKRLAMELGVDPSRISKFESGVSQPSFREVERIAVLLGQPLAYFDTMRPVQFTIEVQAHATTGAGQAMRRAL